MNRSAAALVLTLALSTAQTALAQTVDDASVCARAYEDAQRARRTGASLEALMHLKVCSQVRCPRVAQADCATWKKEVEAGLPTFIVRAKLGRADAYEGLILVDGVPSQSPLGDVITTDPGDHRISVRIGQQEESVMVTLIEGEKLRRVVVVIPEPERAPQPVSPLLIAAGVTGGAAVVGLALFAGLGASGLAEESDLERCKPNCASDEVDAVKGLYIGADIALGSSVVLAAASTVLFSVWGLASADPAVPAVSASLLGPTTEPQGGLLLLTINQ